MRYKPQKITGWLRIINGGKSFKLTKEKGETSKPVSIGQIGRFNGWLVELFFNPREKAYSSKRKPYERQK